MLETRRPGRVNAKEGANVIRSVPSERRAFLILAVATLGLACIHPAVDAPGVPLYPNGEATRLPRSQIG